MITKKLKNGIPAFDANGTVSMIPRSAVDNPFGFIYKQIAFQEAPSGVTVLILISDIGAYPVATGFAVHGFTGLCMKTNVGSVNNGFGTSIVDAIASHNLTEAYGHTLTTTLSKIVPKIVKYNGRAYVAIAISGNSGTLCLIGTGYELLDSPIILNNRNGMNVSDAEVLYDCVVGGG